MPRRLVICAAVDRYGNAVIAVRRSAPLLLLCAVTACSTPVPGEPVPAVGFQEPPTRATAVGQHSLPASVDPCTLLTPEDLVALGGTAGPPRPDQPMPGVCSYPLTSAPANAAAVGLYHPLEVVAARQPGGVAVEVEGRSAWLYCELVDGHQTCTATTALAPDRSLLTMLTVEGASAADTTDHLFGLTTAALHRLTSR